MGLSIVLLLFSVRETLETPPTAGDAVLGKASQDKAEAMFLEAKQKKHLTRAKKDTDLPVNKNRKEKSKLLLCANMEQNSARTNLIEMNGSCARRHHHESHWQHVSRWDEN